MSYSLQAFTSKGDRSGRTNYVITGPIFRTTDEASARRFFEAATSSAPRDYGRQAEAVTKPNSRQNERRDEPRNDRQGERRDESHSERPAQSARGRGGGRGGKQRRAQPRYDDEDREERLPNDSDLEERNEEIMLRHESIEGQEGSLDNAYNTTFESVAEYAPQSGGVTQSFPDARSSSPWEGETLQETARDIESLEERAPVEKQVNVRSSNATVRTSGHSSSQERNQSVRSISGQRITVSAPQSAPPVNTTMRVAAVKVYSHDPRPTSSSSVRLASGSDSVRSGQGEVMGQQRPVATGLKKVYRDDGTVERVPFEKS